ncbi:MAG: hypothetical protein HYY30_05260 [Chloroflexi bacterium]|nr:hypothetical protein [Chloroflexota bacterium]
MESKVSTDSSKSTGAFLIAITGIGLIGYAGLFIAQNFVGLIEIGIQPAEVGVTREQIQAFSQSLHDYISHVQIALGGFIASTGLALAIMAWYGVRRGEAWAWWGVVLTTVAWAAIATPFHYVYGYGSLAHLGPTYLALVLVAIGAYLARPWR